MEHPGNSEKRLMLSPLVQMVLDGKKPGAFVDRTIESHKYFGLGLETVSVDHGTRLNAELAVAKRRTVSEVLGEENILIIPEIEEGTREMWSKIKNMNIAPALAYLSGLPMIDDVYTLKNEKGVVLEKPEVALFLGKLLGYRDCCIKYYIETRYLDLPKDEVSERINKKIISDNPHIRCPDCVANERFD